MEIAVLINNNGESISFNENGVIRVYSNETKEWKITNELTFEVEGITNSKEFRDTIRSKVMELGGCKLFVAKEVKGIPYAILDGMGFTIWELDGITEEFLDYIYEKEEEEKANKLKPKAIPVPIINGQEGHYFFDMKTELQNNPELTSKQVLLPFLRKTSFNEFEIICGHIPPWFNKEFNSLNLRFESEQIRGNTFKVKVYPM